jgi:hypothetical protein
VIQVSRTNLTIGEREIPLERISNASFKATGLEYDQWSYDATITVSDPNRVVEAFAIQISARNPYHLLSLARDLQKAGLNVVIDGDLIREAAQ